MEFTLGGGVYDVWYDRFYNEKNGPKEGSYHTTFVGIDNVSVTFSYSFDLKKVGGVDEKRIENNDGLAGCDGIVCLLRGPRMA